MSMNTSDPDLENPDPVPQGDRYEFFCPAGVDAQHSRDGKHCPPEHASTCGWAIPVHPPAWTFRITALRVALLGLAIVAVGSAIYRLVFGLGVSTNLNDRWPWGLWIILDLIAVALAGGGYSMAVLTHVMRIHVFHALARRGLLISLLAYVFVLLTLLLEVGRWDNVYRPLVSWGYHSPLFEVFVAISLYMVIQGLEFAEILTERVCRWANRFVLIALPCALFAGALIPFGHQASLGAVYLVLPDKLHALWYSPMLPWFFLTTSFFVGPAVVLLDALWSKPGEGAPEKAVLVRLARISGRIMAVYLVWKLYDVMRLDNHSLIFAGGFESWMFIVETAAGVCLPVLLYASPWIKTTRGLAAFSLLTIGGVAINRFNVVFVGMYAALGPGYRPNFVEWSISIGLLAAMVLAYLFIVENFRIRTAAPHAVEA